MFFVKVLYWQLLLQDSIAQQERELVKHTKSHLFIHSITERKRTIILISYSGIWDTNINYLI